MKIFFCICAPVLLLLLAVFGYFEYKITNESLSVMVLKGKTMGTFWCVNMMGVDKHRKDDIYRKIQSQLDMDDQLLSTYKDNSMLMRFNHLRSTLPWVVNEAIADIVTKSLRVGYKTNGAMDITVGPLVNLWGFGPDEQPIKTPDQEEIDNIMKRTGLQHLEVINQAKQQFLKKDIVDLFVDLSTVGEGYAADHLATLLVQEGISRYLVSVGGALVSRGTNASGKPWRVAIQEPINQKNIAHVVVDINGHGISTSGSYQNYYELDGKYVSHIINPKTGYPITHNLISVTVIAPTALEADAWDTGLMVLGVDKAKEIALQQKLAVFMFIKQKDSFKTWMSPQFTSFLINKKIKR